MKYGPYICIGVVLAILFVLWAFWGGRNYDFVGLGPLAPETCGSYTGSLYNWGTITPATAYNPIKGQNCVPSDAACTQETSETPSQNKNVVIDNTPIIPAQFTVSNTSENTICLQDQNNASPEISSSSHPTIIQPPLPQLPRPQLSNQKPIQRGRRGRFISRGERLCCETMEKIYGVPFVSTWPDWLRNPETGEKLELDCYNDELKIAVEYNGEQHYKWPNFTNQSYQHFINQVRRDTLKLDLCDKNGVYLIVVPYNVPYGNIPSFITSHLPETIRKRLQEEQTLSGS